MQLTPTPDSSNVVAIGYDETAQKMRVQFRSGTYDYFDVKSEQWAALHQARADGKSVGSWISSNIVRKHRHEPVKEKTGE